MPKHLIILTVLLLLAFAGIAQEEDVAGSAGETPDAVTGEAAAAGETAAEADDEADDAPAADEEDVDDTDLDQQTYEEDDDDFVPTEEIPADEPIPFPSNI